MGKKTAIYEKVERAGCSIELCSEGAEGKTRGKGVKSKGRVGGWGPTLWAHLLGVKVLGLGNVRWEEASDRMCHRGSFTKIMRRKTAKGEKSVDEKGRSDKNESPSHRHMGELTTHRGTELAGQDVPQMMGFPINTEKPI